MSTVELPRTGLVLVAGISGSGAEARAADWFEPEEIVAADAAGPRLAAGRFTVVVLGDLDADTVEPLMTAVRQTHTVLSLVFVEVDPEACHGRLSGEVSLRGLRHQARVAGERLRGLRKRRIVGSVHVVAEGEAPTVLRVPLPFDRRDETGPFDVIGDVHGCCTELEELLAELGYAREGDAPAWTHPRGRRVVFVGDLVDRGPRNLDVLELAMAMDTAGSAFCVLGNHDYKVARWLGGARKMRIGKALQMTIDELEAAGEEVRERVRAYYASCPSHLILDGGALVVAHGGIRESLIGRSGGGVDAFTRYGDTTGETDEHGYPVRLDWAGDYRGSAHVVYGHTPTPKPEWRNKTVNVDQGCVFGGRLTAARYPELEFVQVDAKAVHFPKRGGFHVDRP